MLLEQSRYELAEAEIRQTLGEDPNDAFAHAALAVCLGELNKFDQATEEAQQAVHLAPDFAYAHYALARIWHERGYDKEALNAALEALRLDSSIPAYFALLANIHLAEARWKEALEAAERGLQVDAEHVVCANLRSMALVKLGRKAEAGATIDATLRRNPENALSHANQGWTFLEKHDPNKALEHFREALRLDPNSEWARRGMVEALKARHFIYALMLRYFLFMGKLSVRGRWGFVLGLYVVNRLLSSLAQSTPSLIPWVLPLQILYLAFVLMTWLASPLFNLLLRLNRFGRQALSREQLVASNWIGALLLLSLLCLLGCVIFGFRWSWIVAALVFAALLLPVSGVFRCPVGTSRVVMACYAGAVGAAGILGLLLPLLPGKPSEIAARNDLAAPLIFGCVLLCLLSTLMSNVLNSRRQRR